MRIVLLLSLFFIGILQGFSQANYGKYNYYTAGARFTYDIYNYKTLNTVNAEIEVTPSFSFGASGGYYVSYLMELHGGFRYSWHDINVDWLLPAGADPAAIKRSEYKLRYISVPLQFRINLIYQRYFKFNIGAGLMPEFRLPIEETVTYVSNKTEITEDIHTTKEFPKMLMATPLSAHMKFNINRHFAFELAGHFNYYLGKLMPNYLESNGYSYSFSLGMLYDW